MLQQMGTSQKVMSVTQGEAYYVNAGCFRTTSLNTLVADIVGLPRRFGMTSISNSLENDCVQQLTTSAVTFPDMVYQTPRLLEVLCADSLKALSATCTFLHKTCRHIVTSITVNATTNEEPADLAMLQSRDWPRLVVIAIQAQHYNNSSFFTRTLLGGQWKPLIWLVLKEAGRISMLIRPHGASMNAMVHQVCPEQDAALCSYIRRIKPAIETAYLPDNRITVVAFGSLMSGQWALLTELNLRNSNIGTRKIASLVKSSLPKLASINLSINRLGAIAVSHLVEGDWPTLSSLDLSHNHIGSEAVATLTKGNWENMSLLDLSFNCLGAAGIKHLVRSDWRHLLVLRLCSVEMDAMGAQYLAQGQWPHLQALYLHHNRLDVPAASYLRNGSWRMLRYVEFAHHNLSEAFYTALGIPDAQQQLTAIAEQRSKIASRSMYVLEGIENDRWPLMRVIYVADV